MAGLLIGNVAKRAGVSSPTIRYYEELGLLTPPPRSSAGYRRYSETTIEELEFIKKAQALGFSLDEIREILQLSRSGQTQCSHVLTVARQHLAAVDERIRRLVRFRDQLTAELMKWDGQAQPTCKGLCQIIAGSAPDVQNVMTKDDLRERRRPRDPRMAKR